MFNRSITISIDDVSLRISYIEIRFDILSEPEFFRALAIIALIAAGLVGTYFILYQRILKFPLPVRKVRKYRKTLDSNEPRSKIMNQKEAINVAYKKELGKSPKLIKQKSPVNKTKSVDKTEKITKAMSEGGVNLS